MGGRWYNKYFYVFYVFYVFFVVKGISAWVAFGPDRAVLATTTHNWQSERQYLTQRHQDAEEFIRLRDFAASRETLFPL